MKINLFEEVALTKDLLADNLFRGDIAVLIDYVDHPEGLEKGAILEIFNAVGESMRVVTVPMSAVESLRPDQMPTVRTLATA